MQLLQFNCNIQRQLKSMQRKQANPRKEGEEAHKQNCRSCIMQRAKNKTQAQAV